MTVVCPLGHTSATADFCDRCGTPISPVAAVAQVTEVLPVIEEADTSPATRREPCPVCRTPRSGDDRFCEACGHDFEASPVADEGWEAIATADREQFEQLAVPGLTFPNGYGERRFALDGVELRIGRSRGRPGAGAGARDKPEIDLAGDPEDPGISRLHAVLVRREAGGYAVRDLGSTNGTTVNDNRQPIAADAAVPLAEGDRIRLGAFTTITIRLRSRGGPAGQS